MTTSKFARVLKKYACRHPGNVMVDATTVPQSEVDRFAAGFRGKPSWFRRWISKEEFTFGDPIIFCSPSLLISSKGIFLTGLLSADERGKYHLTWDELQAVKKRIVVGAWPIASSSDGFALLVIIIIWASFSVLLAAWGQWTGVGGLVATLAWLAILGAGYIVIRQSTVQFGRQGIAWRAPSKIKARAALDLILAALELRQEIEASK